MYYNQIVESGNICIDSIRYPGDTQKILLSRLHSNGLVTETSRYMTAVDRMCHLADKTLRPEWYGIYVTLECVIGLLYRIFIPMCQNDSNTC